MVVLLTHKPPFRWQRKEKWKMAWYNGTYSCGHEGRINIIGPMKDRERKAEYFFSGLCPDCYKKAMEEERKQKNEAAALAAKEMELPDLEGTQKQITWAITLRQNFITKATAYFTSDPFFIYKYEEQLFADKEMLMQFIYSNYTTAKFWIDSRDERIDLTLRQMYADFLKKKEEIKNRDVVDEIREQEARLTAQPHKKKKDGIVILEKHAYSIVAKYVRDSKFCEIVKSKLFKWDGEFWKKEIDEFSGSADERISEVGNLLLNAGFTVRFPNEEAMQNAVSGTFNLECRRRIKYTETQKFRILWDLYDESLYTTAKSIPGAKWNNGGMEVPVEFYQETEDFAETMKFKFSTAAQKAIEDFKNQESTFLKKKVASYPVATDLTENLEKSLKQYGIIEDLKDDLV